MNTIRCVLSWRWLYIVSSHKWPRPRKFRCRGNHCKWRCVGSCVDSAPWGLEDLWPQAGTSPVIHLHFWHVSSHVTGTRLVKSGRLARHIQEIQIDRKRQDCSTWICIIIVTWWGLVSSGIYSKGRHRPMPAHTRSTLKSNQIVLMSASIVVFVKSDAKYCSLNTFFFH